MSGRNEADLRNNDSEGGIDNKRMEIIYQREPHPNMSKHDELETTVADPVKKAQNDEEAEAEEDRVRTGGELDNQEKLQNEDGTANEMNAMTQAQAPVDNARPIWIYLIGGGILALVAPFALSAGRSSAISFVASSTMPMPTIDNAADMVVNAGQLIPWNMMAETANLAGTAGIRMANHAIGFASKGIITPRLG